LPTAPAVDPLVWTSPQYINLIQPGSAIIDVGTAYTTGPLTYSKTEIANGHTFFIYQPGTDAQKMIAYNASTGYWADWNLEYAPNVVSQLQSRLVTYKLGTVVYFKFDSPFPVTADSPAQILQPNSTTTPLPPVAVDPIFNESGTWGVTSFVLTSSTNGLYVYQAHSNVIHSFAYDIASDSWIDNNPNGDPFTITTSIVDAKRIISGYRAPDSQYNVVSGVPDNIFNFEDPYY
jgi:hypothetical protein